ncbi:MAG: hypothetical protein KDC35_11260 [Acidobacteria bacterium]|nr:hypothetical protein [Acidobacteriota bacterium]
MFVLFLLLTVIGMGPIYANRRMLGVDSVGLFLVLSFFLGSIFSVMLLLTLGHVSFAFGPRPAVIILFLLAALSFAWLVFQVKTWTAVKTLASEWCSWRGHALYVWICFSLFFAACVLINQKYFFTNWDHFSFWLTDAKLIYEGGELRHDLNVITKYHYTSFYPLHAVLCYWFMGRLAEQYASLFTLAYGFCGTVIAFSALRQCSSVTRSLGAALLIIMNVCLVANHYLLFTMYAEIIFAAMVAFFVYLLWQEFDPQTESARMAFAVLDLVAMCLLKPTNRYYALVLCALWWSYRNPHWRSALKAKWWPAMASITWAGVVWGTHAFYRARHFSTVEAKEVLVTAKEVEWKQYVGYLEEMTMYLGHHLLVPILVIGVVLVLVLTRRRMPARSGFMVLGLLVLPFLNVLHWILLLNTLQTGSLLRYVTTVFYAFPMLLGFSQIRIPTHGFRAWLTHLFPSIATIIGVGLVFFWFPPEMPSHNGSYLSARWQKPFVVRAQAVREAIGEGSLMLVSVLETGKISNEQYDGYCINYYLSDHVTGGTYREHLEDFPARLRSVAPDYVFVTKPHAELAAYFGMADEQDALFRVHLGEQLTFERVALNTEGFYDDP